jgi:hypothetical protein
MPHFNILSYFLMENPVGILKCPSLKPQHSKLSACEDGIKDDHKSPKKRRHKTTAIQMLTQMPPIQDV